jgi:hypothetical protein
LVVDAASARLDGTSKHYALFIRPLAPYSVSSGVAVRLSHSRLATEVLPAMMAADVARVAGRAGRHDLEPAAVQHGFEAGS